MSRREKLLKYFSEQKAENDVLTREGIEKFRKGTADITIECDGALPDDITVCAEQKTHEFRFGANIFMLDEFETEEKNIIYRKKFPELFNLATVPFYWNTLEPVEGKPRYEKNSPKIYRRPSPDLCVEYCRENGIEPKCHCLNYDSQTPEWLAGMSVTEIKEKLEKRFSEIASRYKDVIPSFEVTNETLQYTHKTPFFNEDDFLEWSYLTADKYFPENRLIINDYNVWDPTANHTRNYYYMQIERLLRTVPHLDSIGFQFHSMFTPEDEEKIAAERYNPQKLRTLMNLFARFGKAEQITEMTIPAHGSSAEEEDLQAEVLTNVYKIFFSHPAMEAIIYWNLADGYGYVPGDTSRGRIGDMTCGENVYYGGLLRFDMSEKPAYKALKNLINSEWHTSLRGKAEGGRFSFRGFFGDYDVTVFADNKAVKKTVSLSKNGTGNFKIKI